MSKLTLNSSQEDVFQYLGLDENKEAYLWYMEKKKDIDKVINYCNLRDLDFCLEDDFDIYFSDSFERASIGNLFGFTIMKEKIEYKYSIEIWHNGISVAGVLGTFDNKNEALNMANKLYINNYDYQVMLLTEKRKPNGHIICIECEGIK